VQVGGGIRTLKDIESKLNLGVERVIIGTKAVKDPAFIKEANNTIGADRIVIGIDAQGRNGCNRGLGDNKALITQLTLRPGNEKVRS
jgi:phosphoribosylformimino-5-aminoimidazole carboxamide ribonucleotide (ProFAR) isomerase